MKAVLLAAGFATRMYPLTRDRAKPLLEVGGEPLIGRLLRQAVAAGADEVVVVTNARFEGDFRAWAAAAACPVPLRVIANGAREDHELRGALADLALALEQGLPDGSPGGFLVAAGDNLLESDLAAYAARFRAGDEPMLLVRETPPPVPPGRWSDVALAPDGSVRSFREKPDDPSGGWSAVGVYFLPADLPAQLAAYLAGGGNPDAPGHFLAWLVGRGPVRAAPLDAPWHDVGSLDGYREVCERFSGR